MFSDLLYERVPLMGRYIDFPHLGLGRLRAGCLAFPTLWIRGCLPAAAHDIRMASSLVTVTVRRWLSLPILLLSVQVYLLFIRQESQTPNLSL